MSVTNRRADRSQVLRTLGAVFGGIGGAAIAILSTPRDIPLISAVWVGLLLALIVAVAVRISVFLTKKLMSGRFLDWPLVGLLLLAWFGCGMLIAGMYSEGNVLAALVGGLTLLIPNIGVAAGRRAQVQTVRANPHAPSIIFAGGASRLDRGLRRLGLGEGLVSGVMALATAAFILHWRWTGLGLLGLALLLLMLQCFAAAADRAWVRVFAKARAISAVFAGFCAGAGVVMALYAVLVLSGLVEDHFIRFSDNSPAAVALWMLPSLVACSVAAALTRGMPIPRTRLVVILLTGTLLGVFGSYAFLKELRIDIQGPSPVPFLGLLPSLFFAVSAVQLGTRLTDPAESFNDRAS